MEDLALLAEAIRKRYKFFMRPSEDEVRKILTELYRLQLTGVSVDESTLYDVIKGHLKDQRHFIMDSLDMSPTVSLLKQIMTAAEQQQSK
jgi:hypothetical protein